MQIPRNVGNSIIDLNKNQEQAAKQGLIQSSSEALTQTGRLLCAKDMVRAQKSTQRVHKESEVHIH